MKKLVMLLFVVMVGVFALALGHARANPGAFDPTWGQEGVVLTDFEGMDDTATTQVLMPDGKLVAAGWVNSYPGDFAPNESKQVRAGGQRKFASILPRAAF